MAKFQYSLNLSYYHLRWLSGQSAEIPSDNSMSHIRSDENRMSCKNRTQGRSVKHLSFAKQQYTMEWMAIQKHLHKCSSQANRMNPRYHPTVSHLLPSPSPRSTPFLFPSVLLLYLFYCLADAAMGQCRCTGLWGCDENPS